MSIEPRVQVLGDIHLLELIFSFLDCSSVKTVRLVCRFWYSTIEKPKFWRWAVIKVTDSNYRELMASHRLNVVQMMMVGTSDSTHLNGVMKAIAAGALSQLTTLEIGYNDVTDVPSDILARAVVRLEVVCMELTSFTTEQVRNIFTNIGSSDSIRLKNLNISWNDISSVPGSVLAGAVVRQEKKAGKYSNFLVNL